ncbi:unnamed protein product, partial [Meganyctiphanes norvegica]
MFLASDMKSVQVSELELRMQPKPCDYVNTVRPRNFSAQESISCNFNLVITLQNHKTSINIATTGDAMSLLCKIRKPNIKWMSSTLKCKTISNRFLNEQRLTFYQTLRTFIYSLLIKSKNPTPFIPFFGAFITCLYNGILHGICFIYINEYEDHVWLYKPNFYIGFLLFLFGLFVNIGSDSTLRNLRKGSETGYKIPHGGMFEYVSCANYFGEIVEMWGYAIASCAFPAIAHALFTTLFLTHRALDHHGWYQKKFEDYPQHRKAVIPFLL